MFLKKESKEFNNHLISPDLQSLSDHVPLLVFIIVEEEFIQEKKWSIVRNSDKEKEFVNELICRLESMETTNITNCKQLEHVTQEFAFIIEDLWNKFSKLINITKILKAWWNKEYNRDFAIYHMSKSRNNWMKYRKTVKIAKKTLF